ncbi:hypothetical protein Glove_21g90 [Diversispora epigaea]|uniref:BTB domain-containing protein n=1 Tax=Diversispora epigaea TaxID=1348612 RepID=A0A397JTV8_9GLOM|nr:hypothetical protein Glove_21g90 [Diversispora epigaea]
MALKFFDKLSQNFIELLNDKGDYNVIIEVENKKSFTAHFNVLKYQSSYFHGELENIQPNENDIKIIIKPRISAQIFDFILKYIYGGIVKLENTDARIIFELMLAVNELKLKGLVDKLLTNLIKTKASCSDFTSLPEFVWCRFSSEIHLLSSKQQVKSIILPARSLLVAELSPRINEPKFSTIISEDHAAEISAWIDRKCHGHADTVVVVKVNGTNEIVGGYNPLVWNNTYTKDQWVETKDSFIFSLKMIIFIIQFLADPKSNFNLDKFSYGYGYDHAETYYEKAIRESSDCFSIDEYEVFEVF